MNLIDFMALPVAEQLSEARDFLRDGNGTLEVRAPFASPDLVMDWELIHEKFGCPRRFWETIKRHARYEQHHP